MKILIAGAGRLGEQSAYLLSGAGHQVTVIEQNRRRLEELGGQRPLRLEHGDACEPLVLERSGAFTADMLLAVTGEDEDNLVIALLAKRQFDVPRVLARVNDPENAWLFDSRWGVDVALPAEGPLVSLIEESAGIADTVGMARLPAAGVTVIETHLDATSAAAGRALTDLTLPAGTVVAAVVRKGLPEVPGRDYRFRSGDTVLVVTAAATESDIRAIFQKPAGG